MGDGSAVCAVWGTLILPRPGGLGTEFSLSEHGKQLGSGRMEHMAGDFGQMPGNEAGEVAGPGVPGKVRGRLGGAETAAEPRGLPHLVLQE